MIVHAASCSARCWLQNPSRPTVHRRLVQCSSKGADSDGDSSLRTLDNLLGKEAASRSAPPAADGEAPVEEGKQGGVSWYGHWSDRPATPPKGPLRTKGMQPGASGEYLESEKFTRDPNRLSVGSWTSAASEGPLALPEATPRAAYALAAAAAALGAASALAGDDPPLAMVSVELGLGANWQLLTASLQPEGLLDGAAAAAALATAGVYAERRLGTLLFSATFFLAGAATWTLCLRESLLFPVPVAACGPATPLLGCAAALAAAVASNWRVLGEAQQRGAAAAAVAGLAAVSLVDTLAYDTLAAALVLPLGGLLGWAAGPRLVVQEELDIKLGSMTISGEEEKLQVVVDHRTGPTRWLVIAAASALVALALHAVQQPLQEVADLLEGMDEDQLLGLLESLLRALRSEAASPDAQQRLFEQAGPEGWARSA
ncbi:hypothetical protein ABPG77_000715 [Micractinium sp. CCAP 211/92]